MHSHNDSKQETITIIESSQICDLVDYSKDGGTIIVDLDDTLMKPTINRGSDKWFVTFFEYVTKIKIDNINAAALVIAVYNAVQSKAKMQLVEPATKNIIDKIIDDVLKNKKISLLALTSRGEALEEITHTQLKDIGIDFSKLHQDRINLISDDQKTKALFSKGIIFCSGGNKGKCLKLYYGETNPSRLRMIDDNINHLKAVALAFPNSHFLGLHYTYLAKEVEKFKAEFNIENTLEDLRNARDEFSEDARSALDTIENLVKISQSPHALLAKKTNEAKNDNKTMDHEKTQQRLK